MALGSTANSPVGLQVAYLRKRVKYNSPRDAFNRVIVGTLPNGAHIVAGNGGVKTAFAGGTHALTVGFNGSTANNINATIAETTIGPFNSTAASDFDITEDKIVYAKLVHGGSTAASAGVADVVIAFVPAERDQSGEVL